MKFNRIVCVDNTKLNEDAISELQNLSEDEVKVYTDYPESREKIIDRIGDAEAVIVSWHTNLDEQVIKACKNLRYIGMACSLYDEESANVAVNFAREKGIAVTGISDYGDPGVAEFIISELIQLLNGYKGRQWMEMPRELTDLKIGIVGLGTTGKLLAKCLLPFGPELSYYSRSRKEDWEEKGLKYKSLQELLAKNEVVSIHLPKNSKLLGNDEFEQLGSGKILINTSLGLAFDESAFQEWIRKEGNYAIFDGDARSSLSPESLKFDNVIASEASAGWSAQTLERLSTKVLENVKKFTKEH